MQFKKQNFSINGFKFKKCRIISSLTSFSLCIFYIVSESMSGKTYKYTLLYIAHINILLYRILFPDHPGAPNTQACRLRLRYQNRPCHQPQQKQQGRAPGRQVPKHLELQKTKGKKCRGKKSRMPKCIQKHSINVNFSLCEVT